MPDTIVVALITGGLALAGSFITGYFSMSKNSNEMNRKLELHSVVIDTKLESLTDEVRKNNNLVERVYKLEKENTLQNEKIAVANHRIDDLERTVEKHHG